MSKPITVKKGDKITSFSVKELTAYNGDAAHDLAVDALKGEQGMAGFDEDGHKISVRLPSTD